MLDLKVINIYGGPGSGKSTTAAGLFNLMKGMEYRVELVTEFAKDLTYRKDDSTLHNQLAILGEQDRRIRSLVGQVDWVITDSPLPLGLAYMSEEYSAWLPQAIWAAFGRYQNYHVLVERPDDRPYAHYGRSQTEGEAMKLGVVVGHLFDEAIRRGEEGDFAVEVTSDFHAPYRIFEEIIDGE